MVRKSPYEHEVSSHIRAGHCVKKYSRGEGKKPKKKELLHLSRSSFLRYTRGRSKMDHEDRMRKQWERGHSGDTDMSFVNMNKEEYYEYRHLYAPFDSIKDIESYDIPRSDMKYFYGPTERKIYIGKGNDKTRKKFGLEAKNVTFNNFTKQEVLEMGPLYLQIGGQSRGAAGTTRHIQSIPHKTHITGVIRTPHMIYLKDEYVEDPQVLTHELVHAARFGMKDYVNDRDREEKETDLESMCRLSAKDFSRRGTAGYYWYIPEIRELIREDYLKGLLRLKELQSEDRRLIIGKNYRLTGKILKDRINNLFYKTHISKAHFSPGERLDRYFIIKKGNLREKLHIGYIEPVDDRTVYADLKKQYPSAQIYEIKDGKEVRI